MMGGNAFLRLTSSVVAGALILNQVARAQDSCAQDCVKTYEGCGSCEDPNLRLLTVVQPNFGGGGGLGGGGLRPPPEVLGEGELCIGAGLKVLQSLTFKYTICASEPSGYGISGQDLPPNAITLDRWNYLISSSFSAIENTVSVTIPRISSINAMLARTL